MVVWIEIYTSSAIEVSQEKSLMGTILIHTEYVLWITHR